MGLSVVQCASIGTLVAVTGRRIYVFVTVAGFTCMSLDHPQHAGYVTVETEEVCAISDVIRYYHLVTKYRKRPKRLTYTPLPILIIGLSGKQKHTSRYKPLSSMY